MASSPESGPPAKKLRCAPLAPRPPAAGAAAGVPMQSPASAKPIAPKPDEIVVDASGEHSTDPPASPAASPPAAPPRKRQFGKADEERLVQLWKANIEQYYKGVRRRVLEKMTAGMNASIAAPPFFALKQVENKLSYMEKRYRAVLEEMRRLGFSCGDDDPSSVRISCERKFCLFYDVHDILRDVVGNDAFQKRPWEPRAGPSAPPQDAPAALTVPPGVVGLDTDVDLSLPPLPLLDAEEPGPGVVAVGPAPTVGAATIPPAPASPKPSPGSGAKRARVGAGLERIAEQFFAGATRLLAAAEAERKQANDLARAEATLRRAAAEARSAEAANAARAQRIAALRFLADSLAASGDAPARARVLQKLEALVAE